MPFGEETIPNNSWHGQMIVKIKCDCGTINVVEVNKKMIHKELNKHEYALFGDEQLIVEEQILDEKFCRVCGKRLKL